MNGSWDTMPEGVLGPPHTHRHVHQDIHVDSNEHAHRHTCERQTEKEREERPVAFEPMAPPHVPCLSLSLIL